MVTPAGRHGSPDSNLVGSPPERLVALDRPDLSRFTAEQIAIVDEVISWLRSNNAAEVSDRSHALLAWQVAEDDEEIPLEAAFVMDMEPKPGDPQIIETEQAA